MMSIISTDSVSSSFWSVAELSSVVSEFSGLSDGVGCSDGDSSSESTGLSDGDGSVDDDGSSEATGLSDGDGSVDGDGSSESTGLSDGDGSVDGDGSTDALGSFVGSADTDGSSEAPDSSDGLSAEVKFSEFSSPQKTTLSVSVTASEYNSSSASAVILKSIAIAAIKIVKTYFFIIITYNVFSL